MSLSIKTSNPNNIYAINCGTSNPKLSGSVNITAFPNLTSFICVDNDITSFTALEYMPSLLVFLLSSNKLTGTFSLTGFPNIQNVNLNNNLFDVIIEPDVMPSILTLNLDSNPLSGSFNLDRYPNIVTLNLSNTSISALNTSTSSLTSLQSLVAEYAKFTGTFDTTKFPNLTSLDLYSNNLTAINIPPNSPIQVLNLYYNPNLAGTLDLSLLPNLTEINVNYDYSLGLSNYGSLTGIQVINARDTLITGLETLNNKPNIKVINFAATTNNKYISLSGQFPDLSNLTNLEVLYLNNSSLSGTNAVNLSACSNLRLLFIQQNALTGPHPILPPYSTALTDINIQGASRQKLTGPIPSLSSFPNLIQYIGSQNAFTGEIPTLDFNPNLKTFIIEGTSSTNRNGFTKINSLSGAKSLQTFTAFYNSLSGTIPSLNGLSALKTFNVFDNSLSGEIPSLDACKSLTDFQVYINKLTKINSLSGATNLQTFYAHINALSGTIPSLNGLSALKDFQVYSNSLSGEIPSLDDVKNLTTFRVYSNKLTKINSLSGATNLATFHAYSNALSGNLPYLGNNTALTDFQVQTNSLSGGTIGPVLSSFATFNASSNILSQSTVNGILSSFAAAGRNSGTRTLNIGTNNSAPDFTTNCIKLTSARMGFITNWPASTFTRPANSYTVTANVSSHGFVVNDIITINNIGTGFNTTTSVLSVANVNRFTYTSPTSSASILNSTASTTGRIYKTLTSTTPLSSYQRLALPTTLGGLGWTVTIVFQQ